MIIIKRRSITREISRTLAYMLSLCLCAAIFLSPIVLSGCKAKRDNKDNGKLSIVTTLFPQYDFARQIAGDRAEVILLLKPGTEAHDYEPSVSDMIKINDADLFIYTGDYMEPWASSITESIDNKELNILDASMGVKLYKEEHESFHGEDDGYDEHEEEVLEQLGAGHHHEYDPHIWTSPKNAVIIINNILEKIVELDTDNEDYYRKNAESYIGEINEIDKDIRGIVAESRYDTVYFGGRFALYYFIKEYSLNYRSAFDSCSSETEPSARLVVRIIDEMKASGAKIVFYEELADTRTAKAIADEVGGEILLLHSCHNVSKEDFNNGATYVSLMRQNVINLEKGLN